MKHLYHLFLLVLATNLSAQINLIQESNYEFPIDEAIFAKKTDKQATWVLVSQSALLPQAEEVAVVEMAISSEPAVSSMSTVIAEDNKEEAVSSTPMLSETDKAEPSLYFILKIDNTRIDLGAGERMIYGTENEIVTYDNVEKKIRKFAVKENYLQQTDSVVYSEMMEFYSFVNTITAPNGTHFYVAELNEKGAIIYTIFNEKLKQVYTLKLQKDADNMPRACFSALSDKQIRCFYPNSKSYRIVYIDIENGKNQEINGDVSCQISSISGVGFVEMSNGEFVVYHACYDARATILYAYSSDNKLKWTKRVNNYFSDFQYLADAKALIASVYSVPYSAYISLNALDGTTLWEKEAASFFPEANNATKKNWLVFMPYQHIAMKDGKKTISLLNCYSPTNRDVYNNKLLIFDGKKEQGLILPQMEGKNYSISSLSENRILVVNGKHLAIYEVKN